MKRANLLRAAAACVLIAAASALAAAQTRTGVETPAQTSLQLPQPPSSTRPADTTADEDFDLNIDLRHITESDFHAETDIETGDARGLHLKVGVMLRASEIDVLLRNVHGHVRFRASLAPVQRLLDARRASGTATQATPPSETSP
ncbi:MAG: hypothetical protein QOC61_1003 [Acidobacteriota bacterium]|nr:hypothetical protein [Acidobacteriota bacterium]